MTRVRQVGASLAALMVVALLTACAQDDDDDAATPTSGTAIGGQTAQQTANPSASSTAAQTGTPAPTPTLTAQQGRLAILPNYFVHDVSAGETLAAISRAYGVAVTILRADNGLPNDTVIAGQQLVIRLVLPGDLAFIPESTMQDALKVGDPASGKLLLLQPSLDLRSGYLGKLVLHRTRLADGTPAAEGYGFITEYWLADRPPVKAGELDRDARVTEPAFIVAGGALAASLSALSTRTGDLHTFQRDGVTYAVLALRGAQIDPSRIAAGLQTALER
jgi:LysM repeat protein